MPSSQLTPQKTHSPYTPVSILAGVGSVIAQRLEQLGIHTLMDMVWYFPRRYEDLSAVTEIIDVVPGEKVTVRGRIEQLRTRRSFRRKLAITEGRITDSTGSLNVIWFNQPYIATSLKKGDEVFLSGIAKQTKYGKAMQSPVFEKATQRETTHTARIVPAYPLTGGITQKQLRYYMKQALKAVLPFEEYLPHELLSAHELVSLTEALQHIHFPDSNQQFDAAERRFHFEQLYWVQLANLIQRKQLRTQTAPEMTFHESAIQELVANLPFTLTNAQRRAAWAIVKDLERSTPMNRLLIGDVGSGKTVVAAIAAYTAVLNGFQVALMAPTEIVAKQHFATLQQLFRHKTPAVRIELRTSSTQRMSHSADLTEDQQAEAFEPDIIVGTHALIQAGVIFRRLGLAIIDEQHRFGVEQRKHLRERSGTDHGMPHLLSLSATPIPRTLALTLYGDLDVSLMTDMPAQRKRVITRIVDASQRQQAYDFIRERVAQGEQCFVICPLIEPSDTLGVRSVTAEHERLSTAVFPAYHVAMLHGKMKSAEKDKIMAAMRRREIDILIATSVIEVGVDIPDATVMLIEGAERFGLAQLHQFRGRVGRSDKQSYCYVCSDAGDTPRLRALAEHSDGFRLAEIDLTLRGAGELFGKQQSGFSEVAQLAFSHPELVEETRRAAEETIHRGWIERFRPLQQRLNRFLQTVHLE